ncbi:hypothetical protein [Candidatus Tisiphia endosymbiont of Nedyus quadrimaculatus]|uniref:hypothetical protein n=1 Tax=Candidatus Tisiphia endosymbiont of Nedyus quadrimaculatus TaxID=3139332 RepID=UPI00345EFFDF
MKPASVDLRNKPFHTLEDKRFLITQLQNKKVCVLNLSGTAIKLDAEISEALKANPIAWLDLSNNKLTNQDVKVVADSIQNNSKLSHVNLSNNLITSEGIEALLSALTKNKTLTYLNLSHNNLEDKGATIVANLLADKSTTITTIHLDHNSIKLDGISALSASLTNRNNTITNISLAGNYIAEELVVQLAQMLKCNHKVRSISCTDNDTNNEPLELHAQKLFNTIIKIRDSKGSNQNSQQQELNKLTWECVVPYSRWKKLFEVLVIESNQLYPFDVNACDADGKPMANEVYNQKLQDLLSAHGCTYTGRAILEQSVNSSADLVEVSSNYEPGMYELLNNMPPPINQNVYEGSSLSSSPEGIRMRTLTCNDDTPTTENMDSDPLTMTIIHGNDTLTERSEPLCDIGESVISAGLLGITITHDTDEF